MKFNFPIYILLTIFLLTGSCGRHENAGNNENRQPQKTELINSVKRLDSLSFVFQVIDNPLSVMYARKALSIAQTTGIQSTIVLALRRMGGALIQDHMDSSFYYYNRALNLADQHRLYSLKPAIFCELVDVYQMAGDKQTAIVMADSAILQGIREKVFSAASDAYNMIGLIYSDMQDEPTATVMFDSAYRIAQKYSLEKEMIVTLVNRSKMTTDTLDYKKKVREAIFRLKQMDNSEEGIATMLVNLGIRVKDPDSAIAVFREGLYYSTRYRLPIVSVGAYNNMAYCYLDKNQPDSAEYFLKMAIPLAIQMNNDDWLSTLYASYADIKKFKNEMKEANELLEKSIKSRETASQKSAAQQVRFLTAMLDLKNKEIIIDQQQRQIQKSRTRFQSLMSVLVICLVLFVSVLMGFYFSSKLKIQKQKIESANRIIEAEEREKVRIGRELHDLSGHFMSEVSSTFDSGEGLANVNLAELKSKIESFGNQFREISHRMNRAMVEKHDFILLMKTLCIDFNRFTGIRINYNMAEEPSELNKEVKFHIFRITQELLTNASKYAKNATINIDIIFEANKLLLKYQDDGPGFKSQEGLDNGMGLSNIYERVKLLGGKAELITTPGYGVSWDVIVPVR
jgi:signal transduction histidine kinase